MMRPGDWYVVKDGKNYLDKHGNITAVQGEAARFGSRRYAQMWRPAWEWFRVVLVRRRQAARGSDFATAIANSKPRTA